jgi:kynurenine formamidase
VLGRKVEKREVGLVGRLGPRDVLAALALVNEGRIFDLDPGRFPGMPEWGGHPPFMLTTYRTPKGMGMQGDLDVLDPAENSAGFRFVSELMITSMHAGAHLDALCHVARKGEGWYGGYQPGDVLGDFGAMRADAASIPPIIVRGVLLDVARARGERCLTPGDAIGADELASLVRDQRLEMPRGCAVLIRTGAMSRWSDRDNYDEVAGAGIDTSAAEWLLEEVEPVLIGADTPAVEQQPSAVDGHPQPVHDLLLREKGVHLLEMAYLEELASACRHEFAFVCLPLKVSGATASMVRPIALA